eukprot:CAMPEP_0202429822 /NCGR_PEP_ID=MMETSP1345-20130828/3451_1 /ASSEMBLY_ACC=CAM_ASM_000843 /TAXON_ID=342563 /ORGANISM="Fabrea Fabrea salina" /LENGTH=259 /DNA_ID=CAMNT_0049041157 /DNA_START=86 /DNA_END=861 /DNA_ORIENTATION=-
MPVPGQLQMGYGSMPYGFNINQQFGGLPNGQGLSTVNQVHSALTQAGLPVPPYKIPFGAVVSFSSIRKHLESEIDLGNPPIWFISQGVTKLFVPDSSREIIVAKGDWRKHSVCYGYAGRIKGTKFFNGQYPLLKDQPYKVEWVEGSFLEGIVTKDELQRFCDDVYEECSETIGNGEKMYDIRNILTWMGVFTLPAPLLALVNTMLVAFIALPASLCCISWCCSLQFVDGNHEKVSKKVAEAVHKNKDKLLKKGVRPRPG